MPVVTPAGMCNSASWDSSEVCFVEKFYATEPALNVYLARMMCAAS